MPLPETRAPVRGAATSALAALLLVASLSGCSSKIVATAPPTVEPARPAVSPRPAVTPAGQLIAVPARFGTGRFSSALYDAGTRSLVCLSPAGVLDGGGRTPASLAIIGPAGAPRSVELSAEATAIAGDGAGTVFVSDRGAVLSVDLGTGRLTRSAVPGEEQTGFTAIGRHGDGRLVLGSAAGAALTLTPDLTVSHRAEGFARIDGVAVADDVAVVLDSAQTSVTELTPDGDAGLALRAGLGATRIAADPAGRILVSDTRAGQLLVFGTDPLIERQAFPVTDAPVGLAGSARLTWVSQTASNTVIGYDLATGIPVEKVRYPTVRQPDSLAFDDATDTLYVVSGSGDGVQIIRNASGAR